MHTATRLARELAASVDKPVCCFGLYAHMCADVAERVIAGEYERALVDWVEERSTGITIELGRAGPPRSFPRPARDLLPSLDRYVQLAEGTARRLVGSVEATRGCAHRCRHCPVPVVYDGRVRIADEGAVLADIAQLVAGGRDAHHLRRPRLPQRARGTRAAWSRRCTTQFPDLTFDCTVKVEHILRHATCGPSSPSAGCVFVVSAFESVDDAILERLDKGHTAADAALAVAHAPRPRASTSARRSCRSRRGRHATTSSRCSTSCTSTTSSTVSTRCSTRSGCCCRRARSCSTTPTSHAHVGPWDDGAPHLRVDVGRRPRWTSCNSSWPRWSSAASAPATRRPRSTRRVREAVGRRARRPPRSRHRPPPPHRALVLLRRADHRAAPGRRLHRSWSIRHSRCAGASQ